MNLRVHEMKRGKISQFRIFPIIGIKELIIIEKIGNGVIIYTLQIIHSNYSYKNIKYLAWLFELTMECNKMNFEMFFSIEAAIPAVRLYKLDLKMNCYDYNTMSLHIFWILIVANQMFFMKIPLQINTHYDKTHYYISLWRNVIMTKRISFIFDNHILP